MSFRFAAFSYQLSAFSHRHAPLWNRFPLAGPILIPFGLLVEAALAS
jgi:hypothetical protein